MKTIKKTKKATSKCKGLFYKGEVNKYINKKDEIVYTQKMIPLEKKSCPGCPICDGMLDVLYEAIENYNDNDDDYHFPMPTKTKHDKIYKLKVTGTITDFETNTTYMSDVDFVPIKIKK